MSVPSLGLVVLWLLPLTSGQNATTPHEFTEDRLSTQEASSWSPVSEVAGRPVSGKTSLQTSPPAASTTFLPGRPTPSDSTPPRFTSSTEGRKSTTEKPLISTTSASSAATGDASDPTRSTWAPPTPSSSAQTPSTDEATTRPSTRPTPPPSLISTTSTEPVENQTTGTSPVPASRPPGSSTAPGAAKTTSVYTAKVTDARPGKQEKPGKGSNNSKVVAGLIGGALLVMLVGFLLIYVRKRTLRKQQMATGDWAGPSPFLDGGAGNGQGAMRPSNRISVTSFLTQRLSRRLSAIPDTAEGEELDAMTPASTFRGESKASLVAREDDAAAGLELEVQSNGDGPETEGKNNNNNNSEVGNLSANPPTASAEAGNRLVTTRELKPPVTGDSGNGLVIV